MKVRLTREIHYGYKILDEGAVGEALIFKTEQNFDGEEYTAFTVAFFGHTGLYDINILDLENV